MYNIAGLRDTKLEDHTAFEHREASSDAAVDRQKIACPSPTSPFALQINQAGWHSKQEDTASQTQYTVHTRTRFRYDEGNQFGAAPVH